MLARSTLLRRTATLAARRKQRQQRLQQQRPFVTNNLHKRALSKNQLEGAKVGTSGVGGGARKAAPPPTAKETTASPSSSGGGSSTKPADVAKAAPSGGGGGGGLFLPLLLLGGAGAGAAYYNGVIPDDYIPEVLKGGDGAASGPPKNAEPVVKVSKQLEEGVEEVVEEVAMEKEVESAAATGVEKPVDEEMVEEVGEVVVSLVHPEDGNRVDLDKINTFYATVNAGRAKQEEDETREAEAKATEYNESDETQAVIDPMSALNTAANAMSELQSSSSLENSRTLSAAKAALRSDLDASYFADLDKLSDADLRVRVVQLATEMSDRTKWEAVRLQEFLAMKEKEVGDRYLDVLQKQRLEFEALLAQRLREQEDRITRQANAALAAKEESVQSLLKATSDAREQEMKEVLTEEAKRIAEELELRQQTELQNELARMKQSHAKELEGHIATMEALKEKLALLEGRLEISRNYESGSKRAHLVSAAALALAGKLEEGEGAAVELAALGGAVAGEEGVIASAVRMIPRGSAAKGVPTVADLKASFDESYHVGRQAAMVPDGRSGLGGQLLGMVFSKLSVPPSPDAAPASEQEGSVADGILSLARKYVQLGDLEKAVQQLDRLEPNGQVAYVMRDWKSKAMDRVCTERALKVIKLECALLNKDLVPES